MSVAVVLLLSFGTGFGALTTAFGAESPRPSTAAEPAAHTLNLINFNDFHGRIDRNTVGWAGTVESIRAKDPQNSLLISAGDNISASLFTSSVQDEKPTLDVLNALGVQSSTLGNHEFDKGEEHLRNVWQPESHFPLLGANIYLKGTTTPAFDAYTVTQVNGVRVATVGAITQETSALVSPEGIKNVTFGDPVEAVNRTVREIKESGAADVIVAVYHEGNPNGSLTYDQAVAASPVFKEIAEQTSPDVAAIINGHTHQKYTYDAPIPNDPQHTRPIIQTGNYGDSVGNVVLNLDQNFRVSSYHQELVPRLSAQIPQGASDEEAQAIQAKFDAEIIKTYPRVGTVKPIVDSALAYAADAGNKVVGSITADITTAFGKDESGTLSRDDRGAESTLGKTVANMLRDTLKPEPLGGAQIGVVNPGGLRSELYYAPNGQVTYAQANAVLPFVNNLWTTTLSGEQFKTLLEQQWQTTTDGSTPSRAYLQLGLSDNVTYTFDPEAGLGEHITSIRVDGKPIDPSQNYRVGTFSFLLAGGDNFRVLTEGTGSRDSGLIDRDGWINYLSDHQPLSPDFARSSVGYTGLPSVVEAGQTYTAEVSKVQLTSLGSPLISAVTVQLLSGKTVTQLSSTPVEDDGARVTFTVPVNAQPTDQLQLVTEASNSTVATGGATLKVAQPQVQRTEPGTAAPGSVSPNSADVFVQGNPSTLSFLPVRISASAQSPQPGETAVPTPGPANPSEPAYPGTPHESITPSALPAPGPHGPHGPQPGADGPSQPAGQAEGALPDTGADSPLLPLGAAAAILLMLGLVALTVARKNARRNH